jgi:hypothetical protein
MARGNGQRDIVRDDSDRDRFLENLGRAVVRWTWAGGTPPGTHTSITAYAPAVFSPVSRGVWQSPTTEQVRQSWGLRPNSW